MVPRDPVNGKQCLIGIYQDAGRDLSKRRIPLRRLYGSKTNETITGQFDRCENTLKLRTFRQNFKYTP